MFKEANLKDLGERCAMTFIQAFLGIVAAGPLVGMDVVPMKAGAAAGVAAVLSVVKTYVAQHSGDKSGSIIS